MQRLADSPELLDGKLDTRVLQGNLRDLARVNRWLGGSALSWRAIAPFLSPDRPTSLLDVGTGAADIPREMLRRARARGTTLEILATDIRPQIVDAARAASAGFANLTVDLVEHGPLPDGDGSHDIVHASLLLHHLEEAELTEMLRQMARVSRRAVIVNDLDRGRVWWIAAWLLTRVATRNGYTRHDAPLSVRRAYRPEELAAHAAAAGLRLVRLQRAFPPYRYALTFVPEHADA
jgi:ubiquinone/menaquinone biosynthesis C-methylase UbiE